MASPERKVPPGPEPERELSDRAAPGSGTFVERFARKQVLHLFSGLTHGRVTVVEDGVEQTFGRQDPAPEVEPLHPRVHVHQPGFWPRIAFGGSIGAAESYVEEQWTASDLTEVIRLVARHPELNRGIDSGLARLFTASYRRWHALRENSKSGSRANIAAHYDLGNELFSRFLDPTMMYSCAIFDRERMDLAAAQRRKLDLVCQKLDLGPGRTLLEIGTGWGGLALYAAREYGVEVVTTTLSERQADWARERFREAGVDDRVTLLMTDYRDLPSALEGRRFDRLVSIEMIEAVGERFLGDYFEICAGLLNPDGLALIQAITMEDRRYDTYRKSTDFIQRYIFPGSFLPSMGAMTSAIAQRTDLRIADVQDITRHYPPTLAAWREALMAARAELREFGYSDDFFRLWDYYFCYCAGGFLEHAIGDVQLLLAKPLNRRAPIPAGL